MDEDSLSQALATLTFVISPRVLAEVPQRLHEVGAGEAGELEARRWHMDDGLEHVVAVRVMGSRFGQ